MDTELKMAGKVDTTAFLAVMKYVIHNETSNKEEYREQYEAFKEKIFGAGFEEDVRKTNKETEYQEITESYEAKMKAEEIIEKGGTKNEDAIVDMMKGMTIEGQVMMMEMEAADPPKVKTMTDIIIDLKEQNEERKQDITKKTREIDGLKRQYNEQAMYIKNHEDREKNSHESHTNTREPKILERMEECEMDKEKKLFDEEYLEGPIGQVTKEENTGEMINLMNVWAEGNGINKGTTCFDVTHDETAEMATVWVEGTQKHTYKWTKEQGTTKKKYAKIGHIWILERYKRAYMVLNEKYSRKRARKLEATEMLGEKDIMMYGAEEYASANLIRTTEKTLYKIDDITEAYQKGDGGKVVIDLEGRDDPIINVGFYTEEDVFIMGSLRNERDNIRKLGDWLQGKKVYGWGMVQDFELLRGQGMNMEGITFEDVQPKHPKPQGLGTWLGNCVLNQTIQSKIPLAYQTMTGNPEVFYDHFERKGTVEELHCLLPDTRRYSYADLLGILLKVKYDNRTQEKEIRVEQSSMGGANGQGLHQTPG